ncbi:MAG: hypothetical protein U9R51_03895 [Actinomycetota bacterium]|nr:hypothetical protein [Actinomycetota bacterium]
MTTTDTLRRSIIATFAALGVAFALTGTASAQTPTIPDDAVVVSSTVLGSGSFTMTATNVGALTVDLDLEAPGDVSSVVVDFGSYDGRWVIERLVSGATATMTGLFAL